MRACREEMKLGQTTSLLSLIMQIIATPVTKATKSGDHTRHFHGQGQIQDKGTLQTSKCQFLS